MASFILRRIEEEMGPDFWPRVKAKAALQQRPIKRIVLELIRAWLDDTRSVPPSRR